MKFSSGHQPNNRPSRKGRKNKNTMIYDGLMNHIIDGGYIKFNKELNKLKGRDYVNAICILSSKTARIKKDDLLISQELLFEHLKEKINETSKQ